MATPNLNEYQQQAIEALRRQQDAYLASVRAWKKAAGSAPTFEPPTMPATPSAEGWPTPAELAEANQAFMTRVMEQQQRFLDSLGDILGSGK